MLFFNKKSKVASGADSAEYKQSFNVTKKQYGNANARELVKLQKIADKVLEKEPQYAVLSDEELAAQTDILKNRFRNGETLDDILPDAFAVCREASWRVLHQKHFYVQIMGGISLHQGRICQMATGEGKTLTETLPAYLNALAGKGVHIVTVNEYLASRDAEWMGKVYRFLGLTVGVTLAGKRNENYNAVRAAKQQAYACDITYGTNSEFGFDYLRDNMAKDKRDRVQRGLNFVIIDEVDSILIDEARTPLIISGAAGKPSEEYKKANTFVVTKLRNSTNTDEQGNVISDGKSDDWNEDESDDDVATEDVAEEHEQKPTVWDLSVENIDICGRNIYFDNSETEDFVAESFDGDYVSENNEKDRPNGDYVVDLKQKTVRLTEKGIRKAEKFYGLENLSDGANSEINHYINNALRAHALMHRNDDYIIERGRVIIVDSFTGRKMEGRRYSDGLHQAIEAKEGVTINEENKTLATITLQNFFRLYRKKSGMTGTAKTEEQEFNAIYNIDVVVIPTNKPLIRKDYDDRFYQKCEVKLNAIVQEIKDRNKKGQPVLVGTATVEKSEELAARLRKENIAHNVLNATQHRSEAFVIAQAGKSGAVTVATNMAGRGTDILLGGNPEFLAKSAMKRLHYDDETIELASGFQHVDDDIAEARVKYNELLQEQIKATTADKEKVLSLGGLCVIGTEHHDSRRIDNQLRGRAGRQGDPGESVFFASAEDDKLRIFAKDSVKRVLEFFKIDENVPIEHPMFSKVIEKAQKQIENMHFSSRKMVLQYDDVNNLQRKIIYAKRDKILDGADIHGDIDEMFGDYARLALEKACNGEENVKKWQFRKLNHTLYSGYFDPPYMVNEYSESLSDIHDELVEYCREILEEEERDYSDCPEKSLYFGFKSHVLFIYNKMQAISLKGKKRYYECIDEFKPEMLDDYVDAVFSVSGINRKPIVLQGLGAINRFLAPYFPQRPLVTSEKATSAADVCQMLKGICDNKQQQVLADLDEESKSYFHAYERYVYLRNMDALWMSHIDALDELRRGIGLQAIGQHDPLLEYKKEAFDMFEKLNNEIKLRTVHDLFFSNSKMQIAIWRAIEQGKAKERANAENAEADVELQEQNIERVLTKQDEYALKREQRKKDKLKNKK